MQLTNSTTTGNICIARPNNTLNYATYALWNWQTSNSFYSLNQYEACNDYAYYVPENNTYAFRPDNYTEPGYPEPTGPVPPSSPFYVRYLFNLTSIFPDL